jgi:N-acetylglucosamine kinase-like BadF-type ATPase
MPNLHLNRIYLGVDIGGTKSLAWLSDSAGHVIGTGLAGAGERRGDDYSVMAQVLDDWQYPDLVESVSVSGGM